MRVQDAKDPLAQVKALIRDFLDRSDYKSPRNLCDPELRSKLTEELSTWPSDITPALVAKILDCTCAFAETTYGHTTHEHRYFIALYTACLMYVDDRRARPGRSQAVHWSLCQGRAPAKFDPPTPRGAPRSCSRTVDAVRRGCHHRGDFRRRNGHVHRVHDTWDGSETFCNTFPILPSH